MSDGASLGIDADRALRTILGGEPDPGDEEAQTREQVLQRVRAATPNSYSGATDVMTRVMLRVLVRGEFDGDLFNAAHATADDTEKPAFDGATGFMAGFAMNQARWLVGVPTEGNPAILVIDTGDE